MARRSPSNERYQKNTAPAGKTRKSAAAAKPKRSVGAAPSSSAKGSAKKSSGGVGYAPPTAEYKSWRRFWWILLVLALVLTSASWLVRKYVPGVEVFASILLGAGYASIFGALYIDWTVLRRLRNDWVKAGRPMGDPAKDKAAVKTDSKNPPSAGGDSGSTTS